MVVANPMPRQAVTAVAEFQGPYGPYVCPERVLQKVWLRGEFARGRAVSTAGETIEIVRPGKWNLLGGPDFLGAELRLGGRAVTGDVEIHFHAGDWRAHGHDRNPAFARVVLHVVLFPTEGGPGAGGDSAGREIPTLVLLPLLLRDLEEFASDDALEVLTARDDWSALAELANQPRGQLVATLQAAATARWEEKVRYARIRIDRLGWPAAAHHTALEVLGYRFNRGPMLLVAEHFPLAWWQRNGEPIQAFDAGGGGWTTHGVRPANQPLRRLRQYGDWVRTVPEWPEVLRRLGRRLPAESGRSVGTREFRCRHGLVKWRESLGREVTGGYVGGTRLDNLVCDGLLPLLAAADGWNLHALWYHWFVGDLPGRLRAAMRQLAIGEGPVHSNCQGCTQGVLGWMLRREISASTRPVANLPDA